MLLKPRNGSTFSVLQELELRQQEEQLRLESRSVLEGLKEKLVEVSPGSWGREMPLVVATTLSCWN